MCNPNHHGPRCICGFGPAYDAAILERLRAVCSTRFLEKFGKRGLLRFVQHPWRKEGWLPIAIIGQVREAGEWVVDAVWLDSDWRLRFLISVRAGFSLDAPVVARVRPSLLGDIELHNLWFESGDLVGSVVVVESLPDEGRPLS